MSAMPMTDDTNIIQQITDEEVAKWSAVGVPAPYEPSEEQRWHERREHARKRAIYYAKQRARETLQSGGYLLHVAEDGITEHKITLKDVKNGTLFLSVWIRGDFEYTKTHSLVDGHPVQPKGKGWVLYDAVTGNGHWSEWRRKAVRP